MKSLLTPVESAEAEGGENVTVAPDDVVDYDEDNNVPAVATTTASTTTAVSAESGNATACGEDRGGCEQVCTSASAEAGAPSTRCSCFRGFRLEKDAKTCTGKYLCEPHHFMLAIMCDVQGMDFL